jgi:hypothetical protein
MKTQFLKLLNPISWFRKEIGYFKPDVKVQPPIPVVKPESVNGFIKSV